MNLMLAILSTPESRKSTCIKIVIKAFRDIDEFTNQSRQILVCYSSNNATNNVCRSAYDAFGMKNLILLYLYEIEKRHMQYLVYKYNGDTKQIFGSIFYFS